MWWLLEMNSSGKNSSSDTFFMFVHELKRQKEKKSNDQQKWMGKSDMSVMTADHSVIKV